MSTPLTADADHCHSCCNTYVLYRHHKLRDNWAKFCREAGAHSVDVEQLVPELGGDQGVVADLRVEEDFSMPIRYGDVVVAHPIDLRQGAWVGAAAGKSARDAEKGKFRDYRPAADGRAVLLVPLAFETYGRLGKHASLELRRIARMRACRPDAQASVDPAAVYRGALLRWRRHLSVQLQLGNAQVLAHSVGHSPLGGAHQPPDGFVDPVSLLLECDT